MLVFGLWCVFALFVIQLIGGLFGAGVKSRSQVAKDAKMDGCAQAIVTSVMYGLGIWIILAAINALS